ncbi:hypothetical protein T484DRAFT_1797408 [Baffinella frigidus]|nr:hypothetical protein T484DRAFT_1797408 [Cryptophyta sp. CCMP2293]
MQSQRMPQQGQANMPVSRLVNGVGLAFDQDPELHNGNVYVRTIMKGGAAETEGSIKVGDSVIAVDQMPMQGRSLTELKSVLRGELGSYVSLTMLRDSDNEPMQYEVSLMRGQAQAMTLKEKQRLASMREQLAKQLQHAQVELDALNAAMLRSQNADHKDRDEIERIKVQIDMEKSRLEEIQSLVLQLQAEKDKYDLTFDNRDVKEEESLEKDQRITWELEDKWKKEKAARDACQPALSDALPPLPQSRIARINAELPGRIEQERIYRENQEALQSKLMNSRDKFKTEWEAAQIRRKEELSFLEQARPH